MVASVEMAYLKPGIAQNVHAWLHPSATLRYAVCLSVNRCLSYSGLKDTVALPTYSMTLMSCGMTVPNWLYIMTMNIVKLHDAPCVSSDTMSNVSINVTQVNALSFSNSLQRSLQEMSEAAAFSRVQWKYAAHVQRTCVLDCWLYVAGSSSGDSPSMPLRWRGRLL